MDKTKVFSVACYCRLSKEDERLGESVSIETQRKILEDFCKEKQLAVYDYYIDDGFTGTNFDRPDFQRMIKDIENGNVNMVIVKDLSRFGREHILVGHYIERVFPKMGVTFLALADDVDTSNVNRRQTDRIMMSVRNVFNEMWPADTSDKVRHALEAKASRGEFIGSKAPYGYRKSPKDKHTLIIDEETAPIIKWIFEMAAYSGYGYNKIAKVLSERKVLTPSAYLAQREGKEYDKDPYDWNLTTVHAMFRNETYLGTVTSFKKRKVSYKSDKQIYMPRDEWTVNPNMHEAIISQELWDAAQTRLSVRKRDNKTGFVNIFAGVLKCDQCGGAVVLTGARSSTIYFSCNTYRKKGKEICSAHYVRYDLLYDAVLNDLHRIIESYQNDKGAFKEKLYQKFIDNNTGDNYLESERKAAAIKEALARNAVKLDELYEDRTDNLITREMFQKQAAIISRSNDELNAKLAVIEEKRNQVLNVEKKVRAFLDILESHQYIDKLDLDLIYRFIKKIVISSMKKNDDGSYHQDIVI